MENSALHKAHVAGREAVRLQRKGLYREAADSHLRAASLLYEIQPQNSIVQNSLDEQGKFHKRQAELAKFLCEISDKQKSTLVSRMVDNPTTDSTQLERIRRRSRSNILVPLHEIRRTFDEADSLLQILSDRNCSSQSKSDQNLGGRPTGFSRRPKNDTEVIEELQTVNSNLRVHVDKLLKELQDAKEENRILRTRLEMYEKGSKSNVSASSSTASLLEQLPARELPELAPLESPEFDFESASSSSIVS